MFSLEETIKTALAGAIEDPRIDNGRSVICYLKGALEIEYSGISDLLQVLLDKTREHDSLYRG